MLRILSPFRVNDPHLAAAMFRGRWRRCLDELAPYRMGVVAMPGGFQISGDAVDFCAAERAVAAKLPDQGKGDRVGRHGAAAYATNA
jgi:hypothetical protein